MSRVIRIATRNSPLAMWQAEFVQNQLRALSPDLVVEIIGMTTKGDQLLDSPLSKIGGKGLFVKELEMAMLEDRADIAVHSMKDVGVSFPKGLGLGVILKRHNPFDAFVSNNYPNLDSLSKGSIVGTCSLRRVCQLKARYPDLVFKDLRGNIHTRLAKLDAGEYDAIILAAAGLQRMQMDSRIKQIIPETICLPAIAQGSMGIEYRTSDTEMLSILSKLSDSGNTIRATAERAVNERLNGSCQTPIAAFATILEDQLKLDALIGSPDGKIMLRSSVSGDLSRAYELGISAADKLIEQGALDILAKITK